MRDDDSYITFQANLLKIYRKKKGLSQTELSNQSGVSRSVIAMLETGKRGIKSKMLITLLNFYGVSIKSFNKRVSEIITDVSETSPYEEGLGEEIEHEWMRLEEHKERQKIETINDFTIRQYIVQQYDIETLSKLNKLCEVYYEMHFRNLRLNRARKNPNIKALRKKGGLFFGTLTSMELKREAKKNYALKDSTDRYFKKMPKLFYFHIYQTFKSFKKSKKDNLISDTILILRSLVKQNQKVFNRQLLYSNEMAKGKPTSVETSQFEFAQYLQDSILEMKAYVAKYPQSYRDNFKKILEAETKS